MADEQPEGEEQAKSPVVKIVLIVVGILLLIALSVVGTLFATGFFDSKEQDNVEEQIAELEAEAEAEAGGADGEGEGEEGGPPEPVALETPELKKFKKSYLELEKNFVSNVKNSRKVIQVQIGVMTHYDDKVITNIETHEVALRHRILNAMGQVTEDDVIDPDFRKNLADIIKLEMNSLLEEYEDFGGIEEVFFTDFVMQ
ncbi:MAG: flagellar basal body-associated FliL family protein [Pseudomonadota bacterium]|nr:flagellar basal body-associated FliL family protein [Pseudomonadota bacterium]